jgi:hypothetical protein
MFVRKKQIIREYLAETRERSCFTETMRSPRTLGGNTGTPVHTETVRSPRTLGRNTGTPMCIIQRREPRTLGRKARTLALALGEDVHSGAVNADKVQIVGTGLILYPSEGRFFGACGSIGRRGAATGGRTARALYIYNYPSAQTDDRSGSYFILRGCSAYYCRDGCSVPA